MKNDMREFIFLNVQYRDKPHLTGPAADYIRSETFRNDVQLMGEDPKALARMTAQALKHLALDPLRGTKVEDFAVSSTDGDAVWFNVQLNRMVNFIGSFALPAKSDEAILLLQAIQENLDSRLFKAARIHRRLDQIRVRQEQRISRRANMAYEEVLADQRSKYGRNGTSEAQRQQFLAARKAADDAFDAVYDPLHNRLYARIRAVANAAFDKGFQENYMAILTEFVTRYIAPQQSTQAA